MVEQSTVLGLEAFKQQIEAMLSLESPIPDSTFRRYRKYIKVEPPYLVQHIKPLAMFISYARCGCNYQQAEAAVRQQLEKEKRRR